MIIQKEIKEKFGFACVSASNETQNIFNRFNVTNLANPVIIFCS